MSKGELTRREIVRKSAPLFNRRGYEGTSLSDLRPQNHRRGSLLLSRLQNSDAPLRNIQLHLHHHLDNHVRS